MKKINILAIVLIVIGALFLTGCSSNEEMTTTTNEPIQKTVVTAEKTVIIVDNSIDIQIIDGKLEPNEIQVSVGKDTNIMFHNQQDVDARIDIPMVDSVETASIDAGDKEMITINPSTTGIYTIELNGNRIRTIYAK